MEVAMPISGAAIDCYEDMFKEITRKLYGEDGLPELNVGDRITANVPERNQVTDYDVDNSLLKADDHLAAFGLAALMQNGFPTGGLLNTTFASQHKVEDNWIANDDILPWTQSKIGTYNPSQKSFRCSECDCVGNLTRIAEHWLGTHSNIRAFRCSQCPYESAWARCVRMHLSRQHNIETDESSASDLLLKNNPVLQEIHKYLQRLKNKLDGPCTKVSQQEDFATRSPVPEPSNPTGKRYNCTYCPYATDRRDLFTRHENIHREEKPFQCYVCQKQFNRADHVKKHFLRMHREHPYDLNRIRRHPPKNASGMSYYQKYNSSGPNTAAEPIGNSLSIPSGFQGIGRPSTTPGPMTDLKANKSGVPTKNGSKKRGEKRFTCCYCSWSGVDNWCLKRHMNTHLKPFVCVLCDYKAARSERLATHVLKVHNKRACGKCNFLADEPGQLMAHQQEHHPLEQRNRNSTTSILRTTPFNGNSITPPSCSQGAGLTKPLVQNKGWRTNSTKQHGAARLFSYMEASDGSEPETDSRSVDYMVKLNLSHRIQSDFLEAGDVCDRADEDEIEETELPLFICPSCGCEFEDDASLDTHQYTHRCATSPAKFDSKENVDPSAFRCRLCDLTFERQSHVINHMIIHSSLNSSTGLKLPEHRSRRRKQIKPQRITIPMWDPSEVEVLRHLNGKLRKWQYGSYSNHLKLADKCMAQLVTRRGLVCSSCPRNKISRYHSRASLTLHCFWRHTIHQFKCEHCDLLFRHRYQVVLHGGRVHLKNSSIFNPSPAHVPTQHYTNVALHSTAVPDMNGVSKLGELGMAFLDHTFMQTTNTINHIPIIIPTFPPN